MRSSPAFTLVEILVVIALFGVIVALGLLMSFESFRGAAFRAERDTVVAVLQKARSRAMANIDEASWGVQYSGTPEYEYHLYKKSGGASHSFDIIDGRKDAEVSPAPFDILFTELSGTTTPIDISIAEDGRKSDVSVTYEGTIMW